MAGTRFYLPSSGTPAAITPAVSATWEYSASTFSRLPTYPVKQASPMTTVSGYATVVGADKDVCIRQYISDPINAQTIGVQTATFVIRAKETDDDTDAFIAIGIRVVSNDGTTVRGTILDVTRDGTEVDNSDDTPIPRSRTMSPATGSVNALANDRILIEIGFGGGDSGFKSGGTLRFGDAAATDLTAADGQSSDLNPYVEFSTTNITFVGTGDSGSGGGGAGSGNATRSMHYPLSGTGR